MPEPISEIIGIEDEVRPVIVQFQNSKLQEGHEHQLETGIYKNPKNETVVAVATKEILYTGTVNSDEDLYNNFLLISNKKTGKVRLVAVDTVILAPQLRQKSTDTLDKSPKVDVSSMNELNKQFGSKKIKRITEQRERLKMDIEDVKEQLEQTVAGVQISESEVFTSHTNENDSIYRPPINRDASTKEQVYVLNDIVPEHVLDSLEEEAHNVLSDESDLFDNLSPFIKQHISGLKKSTSDNVEKCKLLLYVDYLIKYIVKPAKSITKKFVICQSSKDVNDHILDNFSVTSNTGRTRPLSIRDKTICYILVLAMISLDYELDIELLSKDIKIGVKKLQEMGRVLAFSSHGKSKNMMVLKIPLPPAVSVSPKKRKR